MTSIHYGRLAVALIGVNASLLGLRYYNHHSLSTRPGDGSSWAGSKSSHARVPGLRGVEVEGQEDLRAQRSELLNSFRDSCLVNPKTTPADLLLPDDEGGYCTDSGDRPLAGAPDPGYTVAKSPGKGMGLFATRFIPARAKILDEKPVLTLPASGGGGGKQMLGPDELHGFVAQVFSLAPALREAVINLQGERVALWRPQMERYGEILRREEFPTVFVENTVGNGQEKMGSGGSSNSSSITATGRHLRRLLSSEERSQLEHILRVFYTNAAALVAPLRPPPPPWDPEDAAVSSTKKPVGVGAGEIGHVGDGLFLTFSRINHSCEANAVWDTCRKPGVMSIRAARDIQPGEEITISYFWETAEAVEKRRERTKGWGFVCQCLKCGPV